MCGKFWSHRGLLTNDEVLLMLRRVITGAMLGGHCGHFETVSWLLDIPMFCKCCHNNEALREAASLVI